MKQTKTCLLLLAILLAHLAAIAQATQNITGKIYDEASKSPLIGAIITLASSPSIGAVTDTDGNFKVQMVPIGRQTFKVSYMGYDERAINDVVVTAGKEVQLSIGMQEAFHKLKEVTVTYNKAKDKTRTNNDMALVSARSFNVDETKRYAGALGDPSRMAANFAGVVSGNDSRNDIVVRGNSPAGMLWQLEGLNIPNPNHYGSLSSTGGPISMLNNNNIDKSDFFTGAFPAEYGNAVSGVFDMKLRDGNKEKKEFLTQLGFNGFELGAEGPLGKKTSYLFNYRYSALSVFQKLGMDFGTGTAVPKYQDLNYKITSNINKKTKLTLFGIAGTSGIDFLGKDVDTTKVELYSADPYTDEKNKYATTINGLSCDYQLSEKTHTRLTMGYSTTLEQHTVDSISSDTYAKYPNEQAKFSTGKMSANWMLMHKMNVLNNFTMGVTYDRTGFNLVHKDMHPGQPDKIFINQDGNMGLLQGFGEWKHRYSNKLSSVAGLHAQYLDISNSIAVEPRLAFRYTFNSRQAIGLGYGMHHQAQAIYTYFVQTPTTSGVNYTNKKVGFTASQHLVATYDLNINEHMRLKAEAYVQALNKVPVEQRSTAFSALNTGGDFGPSGADSLVNKGTGFNYGTELTLERFFDKGFYFLVTGSLFDSRYKGSNGIEHNTAFNTNYVFNALAGKEFKLGHKGSVLALNLKVSSVGGRYFTPLDLEQSRQQGMAVHKEELAFSKRQQGYFRTDFRVAYRREFKRSTLETAIDFQNLTNHQNILEQFYDPKKGNIITVYQQSFFPVPTIRYTF